MFHCTATLLAAVSVVGADMGSVKNCSRRSLLQNAIFAMSVPGVNARISSSFAKTPILECSIDTTGMDSRKYNKLTTDSSWSRDYVLPWRFNVDHPIVQDPDSERHSLTTVALRVSLFTMHGRPKSLPLLYTSVRCSTYVPSRDSA